MKLDSERPDSAGSVIRHNLHWLRKSYAQELVQELQPTTWVKLLELPNPFSYDEALLLCRVSADEWLAWVPDHGEVQLHIKQFCQ